LSDIAYTRRQRARRTAQTLLAQAQRAGADSSAIAHRALLGYLSDKLNRPTVGLTTGQLIEELKDSGLNTELIDQVRFVLDEIEVGRFAPVGEAQAQTVATDVKKLIDELEKAFRRRG
jgi:hypothetical protein